MSNLYASTRRLSFIDRYFGLPIEMSGLTGLVTCCSEWGDDDIQAVIKTCHMVGKGASTAIEELCERASRQDSITS